MSEVRDRVRCVSDRKHARSARPPVLVSDCEAGLIDIAQRRGQPRRGPETRRDLRRITRNLRTAFRRHGHELAVLVNQTFDLVHDQARERCHVRLQVNNHAHQGRQSNAMPEDVA